MKTHQVVNYIANWLSDYAKKNNIKGFVVGLSGGIDSSVTSALGALTGLKVLAIEMPIHQHKKDVENAKIHSDWLTKKYDNVKVITTNLTPTFNCFQDNITTESALQEKEELALANSRARLRMMTLYYYAGIYDYLVLGTGNKIEDFGIGFYTKYGDGGTDLNPIADLLKSEVYEIANFLTIDPLIIAAPPTDGLFGEERTDEQQIGASYPELEWAMQYNAKEALPLTARQKEVLNIYNTLHDRNQHKMNPIPVCKIPNEWK